MGLSNLPPLSRQQGLLQEMNVIAQNISNAQTNGYRQQGVLFSEVLATGQSSDGIAMTRAHGRLVSTVQGPLQQTGGTFDLAIEGDSYFQVETPNGTRLTRAGHFSPDSTGTLRTSNGHALLDLGGAPIQIPTDAGEIGVGADGTLSIDGNPLTRIGLGRPANPGNLIREAGALFDAPDGIIPNQEGRVRQGFVEGSNVDPIGQMARMVEVQRAYELGQSFLQTEDERQRRAIDSLTS